MAVKQVLTLTQVSQDLLENTSQLRILWTSTQTNDSHNLNKRTANYWISINGGEETEYSVEYKLNKKTTDTILDTTITIPHNEHGKAEVSVRTWMDTRISAGEIELAKNLVLTDIPRAALISATDAFIESKSTVVLGGFNSGYVYSIEYVFGNLRGFLDAGGNAVASETPIQVPVINFALPYSFYDQIPNDPSGICTLICRTYSGVTLLGQNPCTFTATADPTKCEPLLTASVVDSNEKTVSLTGNSGVLVLGKSTAQCKVLLALAINGAVIQNINICGTDLEAASGMIEILNVQTGIFEFTATDSRGYVGKVRIELPVVQHTDIVCTPSAGRTDPTSGNGWVVIEGEFFNGSFGAVENSLQVSCTVNGNTTKYTPSVDGNWYSDRLELSGLDYTKSYTVEITVSDALGTVHKTAKILPGIPVFDWGETDFRFNVPVDVPGLTINGQSLAEFVRSIVEGG